MLFDRTWRLTVALVAAARIDFLRKDVVNFLVFEHGAGGERGETVGILKRGLSVATQHFRFVSNLEFFAFDALLQTQADKDGCRKSLININLQFYAKTAVPIDNGRSHHRAYLYLSSSCSMNSSLILPVTVLGGLSLGMMYREAGFPAKM